MEEQIESREVLHKEWARYQRARKLQLYNDCLRALKSQNTALFKLREESEVLYQAAIESDDNLFPIKIKGPVCTSPILNYESPAEYPFKSITSTIANENLNKKYLFHTGW